MELGNSRQPIDNLNFSDVTRYLTFSLQFFLFTVSAKLVVIITLQNFQSAPTFKPQLKLECP